MLGPLFKKVTGLRAWNAGFFSTEIWKVFKKTYFQERLYLHVTLFTVHGKETANEVWLEPLQTYMMEFFAKTIKLLTLKKVLS